MVIHFTILFILLFQHTINSIVPQIHYKEYDYENYLVDIADYAESSADGSAEEENAESSGAGSGDYPFITDDENNFSIINPPSVDQTSSAPPSDTNSINVTTVNPFSKYPYHTTEGTHIITQSPQNISDDKFQGYVNSSIDDWSFDDSDLNLEIIKKIHLINRPCKLFTSPSSDNFVIYC